ncbi:hypothetical protein KSC_069730 [Ktedonobacter sp. SOSP1-52]|nr:hypothetical protein KSC_069730 [Ktedonobacter sp. SOSP1-52]
MFAPNLPSACARLVFNPHEWPETLSLYQAEDGCFLPWKDWNLAYFAPFTVDVGEYHVSIWLPLNLAYP